MQLGILDITAFLLFVASGFLMVFYGPSMMGAQLVREFVYNEASHV